MIFYLWNWPLLPQKHQPQYIFPSQHQKRNLGLFCSWQKVTASPWVEVVQVWYTYNNNNNPTQRVKCLPRHLSWLWDKLSMKNWTVEEYVKMMMWVTWMFILSSEFSYHTTCSVWHSVLCYNKSRPMHKWLVSNRSQDWSKLNSEWMIWMDGRKGVKKVSFLSSFYSFSLFTVPWLSVLHLYSVESFLCTKHSSPQITHQHQPCWTGIMEDLQGK